MASLSSQEETPSREGDRTTDLSPLQESHVDDQTNMQEFIVTNIDEGNTVAGRLISELIERVKTVEGDCTSIRRELEDLSKRQSSLSDEKVKESVEKILVEFKRVNHSEQNEHRDSLEERVCYLETITRDNRDTQLQNDKLKEEVADERYKMTDQLKQLEEKLELNEKMFNELSEKIPATQQANSLPVRAGPDDDLHSQITCLTSKLNGLADLMIPKEATDERKIMLETHLSKTCKNHSLPRTRSMTTSNSMDGSTASPVLRRSQSVSSSSSSGHGTLSHRESDLSSISEFNPDVSFDEADTSTPARQTSSPFGRDNLVNVIWSMMDLLESLRKLHGMTDIVPGEN